MKILKRFLKRKLHWHNLDKDIFDEEVHRATTWFGIFTVTDSADVKHTFDKDKDKKIGFVN
jgi:hypothetical protein